MILLCRQEDPDDLSLLEEFFRVRITGVEKVSIALGEFQGLALLLDLHIPFEDDSSLIAFLEGWFGRCAFLNGEMEEAQVQRSSRIFSPKRLPGIFPDLNLF